MNYDKFLEIVEKYYRTNIPSSRERGSYFLHVDGVRKFALILAEEYSADRQVVEIAALLHDIGADAGKVHAGKSAAMAEELFDTIEVDASLRKRIISAIRNHSMSESASLAGKEVSLEDTIIRDADAISFFENSYEAYLQKGLKMHGTIERAKEESLIKIEGMMNKISTKLGREIAERYRETAISYIENYG
jgi:uncharacterized protein